MKIDIETNERYEQVFRMELIIPFEFFADIQFYGTTRDKLALLIGSLVLNDLEASVENGLLTNTK